MHKLTVATVALAAALTSFASPSLAERDFQALEKLAEETTSAKEEAGEALPGVDTSLTTGAVAAVKAGAAKAQAVGGPYGPLIAQYAQKHGVPVGLAQAVVRIESNFRADVTGRQGEVGLMQIKPATARMMGYSGSAKGLYDPETNIRFGMRYLAMARDVGDGSTCGTILKYNAGHAAKRMNPVSANYCAKVKRMIGDA